jgi:hypothetical protein
MTIQTAQTNLDSPTGAQKCKPGNGWAVPVYTVSFLDPVSVPFEFISRDLPPPFRSATCAMTADEIIDNAHKARRGMMTWKLWPNRL